MARNRLQVSRIPDSVAMKHLRIAAILIGLAAYLVAFYAASMPSFPNNAGVSPSRGELFGVLGIARGNDVVAVFGQNRMD